MLLYFSNRHVIMHANVGKNFKHLTLEGFSKSTSQQDNESTSRDVSMIPMKINTH